MIKKEKIMEKQQLTGPEPATSRSIDDTLAGMHLLCITKLRLATRARVIPLHLKKLRTLSGNLPASYTSSTCLLPGHVDTVMSSSNRGQMPHQSTQTTLHRGGTGSQK